VANAVQHGRRKATVDEVIARQKSTNQQQQQQQENEKSELQIAFQRRRQPRAAGTPVSESDVIQSRDDAAVPDHNTT